jgi:hypothetical protein
MPHIHIQPKQRRSWPWLVGLVVVGLAIWGLVEISGDDTTYESAGYVVPPRATTVVPPLGSVVRIETQQFIDFANQPPRLGDLGAAHEYTRNGLRYLAAALEELADSTTVSPATIAALRQSADELDEENQVSHAHIVRVVFGQFADAVADLQRARFPALSNDVARIRSDARAIDEHTNLLDQGEKIKAFFADAAAVVQRMGAAAPGAATDSGASATPNAGGAR